MLSSLQQKIVIIQAVAKHLAAAMLIDSHPEDIQSAIEKAIFTIRQYPDFEQIKNYPLGWIPADYKTINIERNLCVCLSDHAPEVTLDIVIRQLNDAISNLQSFLQ